MPPFPATTNTAKSTVEDRHELARRPCCREQRRKLKDTSLKSACGRQRMSDLDHAPSDGGWEDAGERTDQRRAFGQELSTAGAWAEVMVRDS
ncbi:hypothetical protein ColLi_04554 [Colletotrichum liriopes]|uniref:Uncharacterized protein n=1 Tax=Colletotrichum liriopes TaxID=708192 RepID=A0AA37LRN2_9PEZI|nr:hypothetical protein ColLi_04554 [Colletotrichum liriopes]